MARTYSPENRKLVRTATEIKRYRLMMKVLPIAATCLSLVIAITYIAAILYNRFGSFTVSINRFDNVDYALALCETPDFSKPITRLNSKASEDVTNISINDLPADLDSINGSHNGANYLAYTFHLKNTGKKTVTFEYHLYIVNVTNNVDDAVRVRLYVNGDYTDYAKTRSDGTGPEPGTVEFLTESTVVRKQLSDFAPGDEVRFTVVMWLEGSDPECVDSIIGGQFKIDMTISIIETE
jgi:archaellum component FlaG (FlaF/FlaG flagellin family)